MILDYVMTSPELSVKQDDSLKTQNQESTWKRQTEKKPLAGNHTYQKLPFYWI